MKRVLFVDDDSLVLQGLQRMLRPLRQDWEMEFVESGTQALERMALAPFDVVVSDLHMPGMNGPELLSKVMERYPQTVRLILSGTADKDLIFKCVGSTHQFLTKPCDPEALKATIQRASGTEYSLQNERLRQLVGRMDRLPSLPALYLAIVDKLNDPDASLEEVGIIIIKDVGMTAKILKLVNSAFFGLARPVASPLEAATYLGIDTIKSLVLSLHVFSQFNELKNSGLNLDALMQHSLSTAARAKRIAQLEVTSPGLADQCFVAGMLHDTGKLVLAANFPQEYAQVAQLMQTDHLSCRVAEQRVLGADHANVGGFLLGLWGLPVPVVEAIALHHDTRRAVNFVFSPLTAVHAANALEHEHNHTADSELDLDYLNTLRLAHRVDIWRANGQAT